MNVPHSFSILLLPQLHLLTVTINRLTANAQTRLNRHIAHVHRLAHGNILAMTKTYFCSQKPTTSPSCSQQDTPARIPIIPGSRQLSHAPVGVP